MKFIVANLLILMHCFCAFAQSEFKMVAQWKQMDFVFPTPQARQMAIMKKQFVMGNAVPLDAEVHYRGNFYFFFAYQNFIKYKQNNKLKL